MYLGAPVSTAFRPLYNSRTSRLRVSLDRPGNVSKCLFFIDRQGTLIFCFNFVSNSFWRINANNVTYLFPGFICSKVLLKYVLLKFSFKVVKGQEVYKFLQFWFQTQFVPASEKYSFHSSRNFINCDCILKGGNLDLRVYF